MGITNGPFVFQKVMDCTLGHLDCCSVYIDDILVVSKGKTEEEKLKNHARDVRKVLEALRAAGMVAEVSKTAFFSKTVTYCGHVLENGERRPAAAKLLAIEKYQAPTTLKELRSFLGLCNYYSGYVREVDTDGTIMNYTTIAAPLMELLKGVPKGSELKSHKVSLTGKWEAKHELAFLRLKNSLLVTVPLQEVDPSKPFYLSPDASQYAVGSALQQKDCNCSPEDSLTCDHKPRPLPFLSRKLASSQLNWPTRQKEC